MSTCYVSVFLSLFLSLYMVERILNNITDVCAILKNTDCLQRANQIARYCPLTNRGSLVEAHNRSMFQLCLKSCWYGSCSRNCESRNQVEFSAKVLYRG